MRAVFFGERADFGVAGRAESSPPVPVPPPFENAYFASPFKRDRAYIFFGGLKFINFHEKNMNFHEMIIFETFFNRIFAPREVVISSLVPLESS